MPDSAPVPFLVLTDSRDVTSDLLSSRYPGGVEGHLRFNTDLWPHYDIQLGPEGVRIADSQGRVFDDANCRAVYWRKPFLDVAEQPGSTKAYEHAQRTYVVRELMGILAERGAWMLVEPYAERRFGKLRQMRLAAEFLRVPEWRIVSGTRSPLVGR